jgi:hypothetical protein
MQTEHQSRWTNALPDLMSALACGREMHGHISGGNNSSRSYVFGLQGTSGNPTLLLTGQ